MVKQAIILAGGQATRLRPYTDDKPKCLVEVGGRSILAWQLNWLREHGVEHVKLACGYKADVLTAWVDAYASGWVDVLVENEPLGRGGALKNAAQALPDQEQPYLALNGDILTLFDLEELVDVHFSSSQALVTLTVAPYRSNWGVVRLSGSLVTEFQQSPQLPYWINGGVYVFQPEATSLLPDRGDHETETLPKLAADGRLAVYRVESYWKGIDTLKDVEEATKAVEEGAPWLTPGK